MYQKFVKCLGEMDRGRWVATPKR